MAENDCVITIGLAHGPYVPVASARVLWRLLDETFDAEGRLVLKDWAPAPATDPPGTITLPRGSLIRVRFEEPVAPERVYLVPDKAEATWEDLTQVSPVPGTPAYVEPAMTWMLLSTDPLPEDAQPGQTYFETDTNTFGKVGG